MTLFIDNIRLYKRYIVEVSEADRPYIDTLHSKNDLLRLCANFPDMRFIIFTNLEDTPTDDYIFEAIPDNVLCVSAVNAVSHGGKVIPAPYGLQRRMTPDDKRIEDIASAIRNLPSNPPGLLYVNHNDGSHSERAGIKKLFINQSWAEVHEQRVPFSVFLRNLSQVKFMICPRGNAIDCHRNWEVVYMRRVPVMKKHPYLQELYKDLPVLFVNDYSEVTEELLIENDSLFQQAQTMDLSSLTLPYFFDKIVEDSLSQ